jgi:hypothetical protein
VVRAHASQPDQTRLTRRSGASLPSSADAIRFRIAAPVAQPLRDRRCDLNPTKRRIAGLGIQSNPTASLQYVRRTLASRVGQTTPRLSGAIHEELAKAPIDASTSLAFLLVASAEAESKAMKTTFTEYRVRPVSRYIVTKYVSESDPETGSGSQGSSLIGEFPNRHVATDVAHAFAGAHDHVSGVNQNILPNHDIPALLRNIAEDASEMQRGIVVLIDKDGKPLVYGLGSLIGDPNEMLEAGRRALDEIAQATE